MRTAVALLTLLAACGGDPPKAPTKPTSPEYEAYTRKAKLQIPIPAAAPKVKGQIIILPPKDRSKNPEDFCEVSVNGRFSYTFRCAKQPDDRWPRCEINVTLVSGPTNWIHLWDSSSNTDLREQVDTRYGAEFTFRPVEGGYEMEQVRRE